MQELTMDRIRELDSLTQVQDFLNGVLLQTVMHEDNQNVVTTLAAQLGIHPVELATYVWFKTYMEALCHSTEDIPAEDIVLEHLGIPSEQFHDYLETARRPATDEELQDLLQDAVH